MRQTEWTPSICVGEAAKYEGHLVLKVPHAKEKALMMKELNLKMGPDGTIGFSEDVSAIMVGMITIAETIILESHLKEKESGRVISKDDLFYEKDFEPVLTDVGNLLVNGFKPSKN